MNSGIGVFRKAMALPSAAASWVIVNTLLVWNWSKEPFHPCPFTLLIHFLSLDCARGGNYQVMPTY